MNTRGRPSKEQYRDSSTASSQHRPAHSSRNSFGKILLPLCCNITSRWDAKNIFRCIFIYTSHRATALPWNCCLPQHLEHCSFLSVNCPQSLHLSYAIFTTAFTAAEHQPQQLFYIPRMLAELWIIQFIKQKSNKRAMHFSNLPEPGYFFYWHQLHSNYDLQFPSEVQGIWTARSYMTLSEPPSLCCPQRSQLNSWELLEAAYLHCLPRGTARFHSSAN